MCFLKFGRKVPIMTSLALCMKFSLLNITAVIKSLLLSQLLLMSFHRVTKRFGFQGKAPIWLPLHFSSTSHKPQLVHSTQRFDKFWFCDKPWVWNKADHKGKNKYPSTPDVCCLQMPNQTNWLSACIDGNPPNTACWVTHQNYTKIESIMVTSPTAIINPRPSSFVLDYSYLLNSVMSIFYNKDLHHQVNPSSLVSQEVKKHCHLSNLHMSTPVKHHWGPQLQ